MALLGVFSAAAFAEEQPRSAPALPERQNAPLVIHLQRGRLTVKAEDVSLEQVLQGIASQGVINLVLDTPLPERVSVKFVDLLSEVGLRRLLQGHNFILVSTHSPSAASFSAPVRLTQIRVLGKVQGVDPSTPDPGAFLG